MIIEKNVKAEDLNGIYKEIADAFDVDTAEKFHMHFKGLQLTFPIRLISKTYVLKRLKKEFTGENLRVLSLKYGYSERWIRTMITEKSMEEKNGDK